MGHQYSYLSPEVNNSFMKPTNHCPITLPFMDVASILILQSAICNNAAARRKIFRILAIIKRENRTFMKRHKNDQKKPETT